MASNDRNEKEDLFPILIGKLLKRPHTEFIFNTVINTMKRTGFPKGLLTQEEESFRYFWENIEHQKDFISKVIDITKIVTEVKFDINIENILKSVEVEKTNIFLKNFYKASTSNINARPIIEKYLIDRKSKTFSNINEQKEIIENEKAQKGKIKNNEINVMIFWIDKNIYNNENNEYFKSFKENSLYKKLHSFVLIRYDNLEEPFEFIIHHSNFDLIFIIISGDLYPDYYYELKEHIKFIKCLPICTIFTSDSLKEILLKRKKKYDLTEEIFDSINNSFYNLGGVSSNFNSCMNFILNFYSGLQVKLKDKKKDTSYNGCLTFEYIYSQNQLVLPYLYTELVSKDKVSDNDIQIFKNFIVNNYTEKQIKNLILPMLNIKGIPHEIISKYFLRIYTENTSFYREMNRLLMKREGQDYQTFIDIMFEGLLNKSISISEDDNLYRATRMSRKEIDDIMKKYEEWDAKGDISFPSFLLYSRCFLSFSKDKKIIKNFLGETNEEFYGIVFKLKNNNLSNKYTKEMSFEDEKIKYYSNADIGFLSRFKNEEEVLFFPYSTFCLEKIYKDEYENKKCVYIELEYLGKYKKIFDNIQKDENFKNTFIDTFNNQNFLKEIIESKMMEQDISDMNSAKKNILEKIKVIIYEKCKIEIEDENNEIKPKEDMYILEVKENNIINQKKEEDLNKKENDSEILNTIHDKYIKKREKEKKGIIFFILTTIKSENMEYIWRGDFNEENKKNGIGKEYDFDDNILFEGEYINGMKKKGIEYYTFGTKKYEGEYKDGKRWNGYLYDRTMEHKYEIKSGNGYIKEFHENGCICFEGDLNNGEKTGKGKIYDEWGHLIFEGYLDNGIKNGSGKDYNYSGELIFEGEFKDGEKFKGNEYIYNDLCEFIGKEEVGNIINSENQITYVQNIMIKDCIWIMENKNNRKKVDKRLKFVGEYKDGEIYNGKGEEYNYFGKLIFEGEYKNGKRYKGAEYNKYGKLIFEGEYKDENRYKGKEFNDEGILIFEGEYKDENRYKGKEFNDKGVLIFEGEYKDENRYKGKEFNDEGVLIFEGEFKDGNKYKGKDYYDKFEFEGEYKDGNRSKGKEINNNDILIFEGEYKDGNRYKGKEYSDDGKLIFEGEYEDKEKWNGIFYDPFNGNVSGNLINGKGNNIKEYNNKNKLVFEGEYKDGKRYKGKGNEYNDKDELEFEGEYKDGKRYKGKGKEYNYKGELEFEGEYENGNRYKGKEYSDDGTLIFEGELKDGNSQIKKYNLYNNELEFEGEYKDGKKYKGKEYNRYNGKLLFEGEYEDGKRYKGKEYNDEGKLEFEGEYKEGRKYKGKEYNDDGEFEIFNLINDNNSGKLIKDSENNVKEYNDNGILIFEGEYKDEKRFKGKEYSNAGELIFEGEYNDGIKWNGKGKEYDDDGILIFVGEYKDGNFYKGKLYRDGELIFEGEYKDGNYYKGKGKEYDEDNILIFEGEYKDGNIYKGKEYNNKGELIFEGKYEDGIKYKGKEYNDWGELRFEGKYEDGNRYKGKEYSGRKLKYEGQYKTGYYKGKFYDNCKVVSEGEFKDGDKWEVKIWNGKEKKHERFGISLAEMEYKEGKLWNGKKYTHFDKIVIEDEYKNGIYYGSKKKTFNNFELISEDILIYTTLSKKLYFYKSNGIFIDKKEKNKEQDIFYIGEYENGIKNGKGKEYNKYKDLLFIGNFVNGNKYFGKEYEKNKLIFEGAYKEGKKWNGIKNEYFFLDNLSIEVELKEGKIYKEKKYNYDGELIFEGEYKDENYSKGKEYNDDGILIYEGEYKDKKRYIGKEYNDNNKLIFEGEYKDRNYYKGKEYNDDGKLIFEGEYKDGKYCKGKE